MKPSVSLLKHLIVTWDKEHQDGSLARIISSVSLVSEVQLNSNNSTWGLRSKKENLQTQPSVIALFTWFSKVDRLLHSKPVLDTNQRSNTHTQLFIQLKRTLDVRHFLQKSTYHNTTHIYSPVGRI